MVPRDPTCKPPISEAWYWLLYVVLCAIQAQTDILLRAHAFKSRDYLISPLQYWDCIIRCLRSADGRSTLTA
ncbi:hypothetical protein F4774DRAFT_374799 [Daldinia eschscholtzii]|nr:hypothetical protein F4774DRAFT_374799 [Daldinia eschscholtzii]